MSARLLFIFVVLLFAVAVLDVFAGFIKVRKKRFEICEDRNGIKYSPGESFNVDDGRNPRHKCKCGKDGVPECHEYYIIPPKVPRPPPVFPPPPNFPPPPHDEQDTKLFLIQRKSLLVQP
ncbi:unnamed protein product [Porites evermanni]|uniref:Uncharacterized protein n=1 Tax=Porites evermanni TaxID=104178 RepID=A0ABN8LK44_9CNID|nr:unnamed protein product [Porites evermanni]